MNDYVIQTVLFPKKQWTIKEAIQWLKNHNLKYDDIDSNKPTMIHFRQKDPKKLKKDGYNHYKNISKDKGVEEVIAYKSSSHRDEQSSSKDIGGHIGMPKHDSSDSDSDSDSSEQFSDDNRSSHDSIIKKLDELKHVLKIHHEKHGGSIKLGKAFHDVGHEMMNGLGLLSKLKRFGKVAKPIIKHLGHLVLEKLKKTPAFHEGKIDPVAHVRYKNEQENTVEEFDKRAIAREKELKAMHDDYDKVIASGKHYDYLNGGKTYKELYGEKAYKELLRSQASAKPEVRVPAKQDSKVPAKQDSKVPEKLYNGKTLAELDAAEEIGWGLVHKHRRQDTSDNPIRSLKFSEMMISSDHPLLNKLSTSDVEDFTKLFEMSKGKKKMDNKKYEALRKLIIKKLKDSVQTESIKKMDTRFTRMVRGSDAAKEWAAKMKAARDLKRK
jgi:hypothetical protein